MHQCKKRVYKIMCEKEDGVRTGMYKGIRYESNRKYARGGKARRR